MMLFACNEQMKNNAISSPSTRTQRNIFAQFLLFFLIIAAVYYPSSIQLYSRWIQWDQDLSHGLPTVAIFLFLVWHALPWRYRPDSPLIRGLLVGMLSLASLAWFLFYKIHIGILAQIALLSILLLFLASCYSLMTLRHLLIPCGVLIFALPVWGILNGPLVEISAAVVGKLARLSGLTVLMDGNNIFIPYGRLYIDDGCSGLRYFVIALLMAYLISYLNHYRIKQTLIAMAVAMLLALLTNWLRIFLLVVIGYQTEMKSSLMEDHEFFGWVLFALVMLPAIYFSPVLPAPPGRSTESVITRPWWPLAALLLGPILTLFTRTAVDVAPVFTLNAFDDVVVSVPGDAVVVSYPAQPVIQTKTIRLQDLALRVELAQYVQLDTQEKLVPYFRSLYDRDVWTLVNEPDSDVDGLGFSILKRAGTAQYHVIGHVYRVGRYTTNRYEIAKLLQIPAMLLGDSYFVVFTTQVACDEPACRTQIEAIKKTTQRWLSQPTISTR